METLKEEAAYSEGYRQALADVVSGLDRISRCTLAGLHKNINAMPGQPLLVVNNKREERS